MMHRPLPRTLEACLRDINSDKVAVRRSAVGELCRFVQEDAGRDIVVPMIDALEDKDHEVRTTAAYCLGDAHISAALPRLLVLVDDPALPVRQAALDAIGQLKDSRATSRLVRATRDERADVRFQAVIALARVDKLAGRDAALRLLRDTDRHVRYVALRTLEELAQDGVKDLQQRLSLSEPVIKAVSALLNDDVSTVRLAAAILLARAGMREGASVLVEAVNDEIVRMEPEDELEAITMAGKLGLVEAKDGLRRRAFGLRRLVTEKHSWAARVALARMGDDRAIRGIMREIKGWSGRKRILAVVAAGHAGLTQAEPALRQMEGRADVIDQDILAQALESLQTAHKEHP